MLGEPLQGLLASGPLARQELVEMLMSSHTWWWPGLRALVKSLFELKQATQAAQTPSKAHFSVLRSSLVDLASPVRRRQGGETYTKRNAGKKRFNPLRRRSWRLGLQQMHMTYLIRYLQLQKKNIYMIPCCCVGTPKRHAYLKGSFSE